MTRKTLRTSAGVAIGGVIAGIEQQLFRTTPPVHELVAKGTPLRAVAADGGGTLDVIFPEDELTAHATVPEPRPDEPA